MSRALSCRVTTPHSFPRVSGDEPAAAVASRAGEGFSPRERG